MAEDELGQGHVYPICLEPGCKGEVYAVVHTWRMLCGNVGEQSDIP